MPTRDAFSGECGGVRAAAHRWPRRGGEAPRCVPGPGDRLMVAILTHRLGTVWLFVGQCCESLFSIRETIRVPSVQLNVAKRLFGIVYFVKRHVNKRTFFYPSGPGHDGDAGHIPSGSRPVGRMPAFGTHPLCSWVFLKKATIESHNSRDLVFWGHFFFTKSIR